MEETRKEVLKPDKIEAFFYRAYQYIYTNRKLAIFVLIAFISITVGVVALYSYLERQTEEKFNRLYLLQKEFVALQQTTEDEAQLAKIDEIIKENIDLQAADLLFFQKAQLLKRAGKLDEAITTLLDFVNRKNMKLPQYIYTLAGFYLLDLYVETKQYEKGVDYLQKIRAGNLEELRLFELGRLYLQMGEKNKARKEFEALTNGFPQSPLNSRAKTLMRIL